MGLQRLPGYDDYYDEERPTRAGQKPAGIPTYQGPPPPGSIGLKPGYTPDYRRLVLEEPSYLAWKNNQKTNADTLGSRRRATIQALVTGYGGLGKLQDVYGDVDPATLDLASRNPYSTTAQIQHNYEQGVASLKRALAARRMLGSSDLGAGLEAADYARGAAEFDQGQQFAGNFTGAINDYVGGLSDYNKGEAGAISQAAANVSAQPSGQPTPGTSATLVDGWLTKYGVPVYEGPSGDLWQVGPDGNVIPFASSSQGPPAGPSAPAVSSFVDRLKDLGVTTGDTYNRFLRSAAYRALRPSRPYGFAEE